MRWVKAKRVPARNVSRKLFLYTPVGSSGTFTNTIVELKNNSYTSTRVDEAPHSLKTTIFPNPNTGSMKIVFD